MRQTHLRPNAIKDQAALSGKRDAIVHARNDIAIVPARRVGGGFVRGT
jgi:hypothetical protein